MYNRFDSSSETIFAYTRVAAMLRTEGCPAINMADGPKRLRNCKLSRCLEHLCAIQNCLELLQNLSPESSSLHLTLPFLRRSNAPPSYSRPYLRSQFIAKRTITPLREVRGFSAHLTCVRRPLKGLRVRRLRSLVFFGCPKGHRVVIDLFVLYAEPLCQAVAEQ